MNPFVEQFRDLSTEYLLEKRALGPDGLIPEAHSAIEQLLRERQVPIPPMPSRPIAVEASGAEPRRSLIARNAVLAGAALIAVGIAKQLAITWAGLAVAAAVGVYLAVDWFRRQRLTDDERAAEDDDRQAVREGLTELMRCSAAGDLARVEELLAYGAPVNATSAIGSTALMYASKNGHEAVVQCLLEAGADTSIRTSKGSTAIELAQRAGHERTAQLLLGAAVR